MPDQDRIIPVPTAESRRFWTSAFAGRLELPVCRDCSQVLYPPAARCRTCRSDRLEWQAFDKQVVLRGWTRVHADVLPGIKPPFLVAEAELKDHPETLLVGTLNLQQDEPINVGTLLQIEFIPVSGHELALIHFRPRRNAESGT